MKGVAGAKAKAEALVSLQAMGGAETMAAGGQAGTLYKYEGRNVSECVAAHKGAVTVLAFLDGDKNTAAGDGDRLFSGSADASIKIWGPNLEPVRSFCSSTFFFGRLCHSFIHSFISWVQKNNDNTNN